MKSRDGKSKFYRHHTGYWMVRFTDEDGKTRNKVCKTITERDALRAAIRRLEELDFWFPEEASEVKSYQVGTFRSLAEKWLNHSEKVREISQSCLMNYRCHLKHHILPVIGDVFLKDLTLHSVERVAEVLKDKRPQTRSY